MAKMKIRLDRPISKRARLVPKITIDQERFGRASEAFARAMGTGAFLIAMTIVVAVWLTWNTLVVFLCA